MSIHYIYKITMGPYFYYGRSGQKLGAREQEHLRTLKANRHFNPKVQAVFNKHNNSWKMESFISRQ